MNEWVNVKGLEFMSGMNELINKWKPVDRWMWMNKWMMKQTSEWIKNQANKWVTEWLWMDAIWMNEWMNE